MPDGGAAASMPASLWCIAPPQATRRSPLLRGKIRPLLRNDCRPGVWRQARCRTAPGRHMRMNWSLYVASSAALLMLNVSAYAQVSVAKKSASRDTRFDTLRPENAFSDWRRLALEGGSRVSETGIGYAQLSPGDPLGANTPETTSGFWLPLSERLSSLVETTMAPGAFGGADRSVLGQVARQFGSGWT